MNGRGRKVDTAAQYRGEAIARRKVKHRRQGSFSEIDIDQQGAPHVIGRHGRDVGSDRCRYGGNVARNGDDGTRGPGDAGVGGQQAVGIGGRVDKGWQAQVRLSTSSLRRDHAWSDDRQHSRARNSLGLLEIGHAGPRQLQHQGDREPHHRTEDECRGQNGDWRRENVRLSPRLAEPTIGELVVAARGLECVRCRVAGRSRGIAPS